jgi:hypothetical protein
MIAASGIAELTILQIPDSFSILTHGYYLCLTGTTSTPGQ